MKKSSKSSKINIIDGFGKKRRDVSIVSAYQISEFRGKVSNHYFMIKNFLKFEFCKPCAAFGQNSYHVSGENVGRFVTYEN